MKVPWAVGGCRNFHLPYGPWLTRYRVAPLKVVTKHRKYCDAPLLDNVRIHDASRENAFGFAEVFPVL
jgi:hypothetical protein